MVGALALINLSQIAQDWALPIQALAIVVGVPIVALYVRRISQHADESGRLAAATAEAANAARASALASQQALGELQSARSSESAPYVIAYLDITEEHLVYAVVKNIGRMPARDVTIGFDPPLIAGEEDPRRWDPPAFLTTAIPFLPPQYELRSILGVSFQLFAEDSTVPREYQANVTYVDASTRERHTDAYTLDLGIFRNARSGRSTTLTDVQAILKELGEQQKSLVDGVDTLRDLLAADVRVAHAALPEQAPPNVATEEAARSPTVQQMTDICRTWRALDQKKRWETAGSLQRRLREIQAPAAAGAPDGTITERVDSAGLAGSLRDLLGHRFYLDGGESLRDFDGVVERFLVSQGLP